MPWPWPPLSLTQKPPSSLNSYPWLPTCHPKLLHMVARANLKCKPEQIIFAQNAVTMPTAKRMKLKPLSLVFKALQHMILTSLFSLTFVQLHSGPILLQFY